MTKEIVKEVLLSHSYSNPIHLDDLASRVGISRDEARKIIIPELIREGVPVCSFPGKGGYFVAQTTKELEPGIGDLNSRAVELLERADLLKSAFYKFHCPDFLKTTLGG